MQRKLELFHQIRFISFCQLLYACGRIGILFTCVVVSKSPNCFSTNWCLILSNSEFPAWILVSIIDRSLFSPFPSTANVDEIWCCKRFAMKFLSADLTTSVSVVSSGRADFREQINQLSWRSDCARTFTFNRALHSVCMNSIIWP